MRLRSSLDHKRNIMTSHLTSSFSWRVGSAVFGALGLLLLAATLFLVVTDDFVIRGQVVPASDPRFVPWRIGLSLAAVFSALFAWLCYRRGRGAFQV